MQITTVEKMKGYVQGYKDQTGPFNVLRFSVEQTELGTWHIIAIVGHHNMYIVDSCMCVLEQNLIDTMNTLLYIQGPEPFNADFVPISSWYK